MEAYFKMNKWINKNSGEQENESIIRPSGSPFVITRRASWCQTAILGTNLTILPAHS